MNDLEKMLLLAGIFVVIIIMGLIVSLGKKMIYTIYVYLMFALMWILDKLIPGEADDRWVYTHRGWVRVKREEDCGDKG